MSKTGRNQPCPCGSGKKYKTCCLGKAQPSSRPSASATSDAVDALVMEGYAAKMSGDEAAAADRWWRVWQGLAAGLRPEMTTTDDVAQKVYDPKPCLYDWLQDFAESLHNAAIDDLRHARRGVAVCRTVVERFTDEDPLFLRNFRADLGQFYFFAGDDDQGEHVLRALIDDFPHLSLGYVRLADTLENRAQNSGALDDLRHARNLLHQALQSAEDADLYDVELRLRRIQEDLASDIPIPPPSLSVS
jgi:hypothetical protein